MLQKSMISSNRHFFASVTLLITNLVVFTSYPVAADAQNIYCNNKHTGEKKHIYVEYLNAKTKVCHTMYNAGGSQDRQIAWAQSNPSLCTEVANNLANRLIRGGWDCGGTMNITKGAHPKPARRLARTAVIKPVKPAPPIQDEKPVQDVPPTQPINEDQEDPALLETIKK